MKTLIISQTPPPVNGSTIMTATLISTLSEGGHEVQVVSKKFSKTSSSIGKKYLSKIWLLPRFYLATTFKMVESRPNVVIYFLTSNEASFLVDALALFVLCLSKAKVVLYLHTFGFRRLAKSKFLRRAVVNVFNKASVVVTLSDSLRHDISELVDETKIRVIPNTLNTPGQTFSTPETGERWSKKTLTFVSNLIPEKGYERFIDLCADLKDLNLDFKANVIGAETYDGQIEEMTNKIVARGLGECITIWGYQKNDAVREIVSKSTVFVFPSLYRYEALPLAILEALSNGVPVVALNVGAIPDVVRAESGSRLVTGNAREGLLTNCIEILQNEKTWLEMSLNAKKFYDTNLAISNYRMSWNRLYNDDLQA